MAINISKVLVKIFGSRNDRLLKRYWKLVDAINAQEEKVRKMTDAELKARTYELHIGLAGDPVKRTKPTLRSEDVRPEALAILREAMDRNIGLRTVFQPEENEMNVTFDPDRLDADARVLYDEVKAKLAASHPAEDLSAALTSGAFGGAMMGGAMFESLQRHMAAAAPSNAWRTVEIPVALYDAMRKLYPESRPPFRARPFDVQMIGGMVLYEGKIAEMATGEGKTFVAPLACFLRVLEGFHCHVVTVNDYLVRRDASWIKPAFAALGLSVGYIQSDMDPGGEERKQAYLCDVTYGTNSEFGFDYLRDNMKTERDAQVQGPLDFAIVDEVDSILIDEARTPLIISGPAHDDAERYRAADAVARKMIEVHKPYAELEKKIAAAKRVIKAEATDLEKAKTKEEKEAVKKRTAAAEKELAEAEEKKETVKQYYEIEWDRKSVHLTHEGITKAQEFAGVGSFYVGDNVHWPHLMEQAMRAHVVYERDKDYVVERGKRSGEVEIIIVDEYTGRKMEGRQWSDGLHQSVEAKERVQIKQDTQTVATITIQNFCKLYKALSGMTGTAQTEAEEFMKIYKLEVVTIPTNRPVIRDDRDDRVYRREGEKWDAIIEEIKAFSDAGRPVLIGTTSVEKSERLSAMLTRKYGIEHEVLNAKQHEREAHIVAVAGQTHLDKHGNTVGNVTIATNMAGRGTDIKLAAETVWEVTEKPTGSGRAGKYTIKQRGTGKTQEIELNGSEEEENPLGAVYQLWPTAKVVGGLHVIGTERHTARRIDNQLRGRSGRQGDPGSSRFYVSLEDELMKIFAGDWVIKMLGFLGMEEGMHIEDKRISKGIMRAQKKVEERNFLGRKNLLDYDEVMDFQRTSFYGTRQQVLEGRAVDKVVWDMIGDAIKDAVDKYLVKDHVAATIAEWARVNFEANIDAADIAGRRDVESLEYYIKNQARVQVGEELQSTLNEYLGENDEDKSGWDVAGLSSWAQSRFRVNLPQSKIKKMEVDELRETLSEAALEQLEARDIEGARKYLEPLFAQRELADWAKAKFDLDIDPKEMVDDAARGSSPKDPAEVIELIEAKARQKYARREVEYPVDFLLAQAAGQSSRVENPAAAEHVRERVRANYGVEMPYDQVLNVDARELRGELLKLQEQALHGGGVEKDVDAIMAPHDGKPPTPEVVVERFAKRFGKQLDPLDLFPEESDDEGDNTVGEGGDDQVVMRASVLQRARGQLREELSRLEQFILLQILDERWKDHLYAMDVLKGTVGLSGFAEKDPRVVYKREGFHYFNQMLAGVRDQVTDVVFRVQVGGQLQARDNYGATQAVHEDVGSYGVAETLHAEAPEPAAVAAGGGDGHEGELTKVRQIVNEAPKVGRNDPCPCGSGKKYKKCHGQDVA